MKPHPDTVSWVQTPSLEPTTINGRYRLDRQIDAGGMAEVHIGKDLLLEREVAVKILHNKFAEDLDFVTRFGREAQSAAKLSHPNIVAIYDTGQFENRNFIVMEYVEGHTLTEYISEGKTAEVNQAIRIAIGIANGLEAAHQQGTIHRDIKPSNILMTKTGFPKIADFGIAYALNTTNTLLTQTGFIIGTPLYFSPEQSQGKQVDARSDLYSLGIVLYEMLNGEAPFTGNSSVSLGIKHATEQPPKANTNNPSVPVEIVGIIDKLLAKNPEDRFESAATLARALNGVSSPSILQTDSLAAPSVSPDEPKVAPVAPIEPALSPQQLQAPAASSLQPSGGVAPPPPQNKVQAPGANTVLRATPQHQTLQRQQMNSQYQPPSGNKKSKILFIVAAVFIGISAIGSVVFYMFNGRGDDSTESASTNTNLPNDVTLSEFTTQFQNTIGETDDIQQTIAEVFEFPEFATPDNSQIFGLAFSTYVGNTGEPYIDFAQATVPSATTEVREISYSKKDSHLLTAVAQNQRAPEMIKKVIFSTEESDIDAVSSLLVDSISGWGEPEVSETSPYIDFAQATVPSATTEVREISYSKKDSHLVATVASTEGQPISVLITLRDAITDSQSAEEQIAKYAGLPKEVPFPEGGTFSEVSISVGEDPSSYFMNPSGVTKPSEPFHKDLDVLIDLSYEGDIAEENVEEKIISSVERSEFTIKEIDDFFENTEIRISGGSFEDASLSSFDIDDKSYIIRFTS